MAIDKVKEYFNPLHMEDHILEFDVSSATVELAAEALHCEGKRIAKTMSFLVGEQPILIVTAGDTKIDNAKYKLTEKFIKQLHYTLKSGTSDSRKDWFAVGDYKKIPN